jgi:hypothetical protein
LVEFATVGLELWQVLDQLRKQLDALLLDLDGLALVNQFENLVDDSVFILLQKVKNK